MTEEQRSQMLKNFCNTCIKPSLNIECGKVFQRFFLESIQCPSELSETHQICTYCLELHRKDYNHVSNCIFIRNQLTIRAVGWATPTSTKILNNLHKINFTYTHPVSNLLVAFLQNFLWSDSVIVPIPLGNSISETNGWFQVVSGVSSYFRSEIVPAIIRNKKKSTRQSNFQERQILTKNEYELDKNVAVKLSNKRIFLLDDNITTGATILHAVNLLRATNHIEIIPVAIERYVSPRILQRCTGLSIEEKNCIFHLPQRLPEV
ncbi:MAG: hypothetical protein HXX08_14300 [Chloroflexi bacterium]|uniref:Phosphoribosyltransferase domain-containing protein n=1 Tax=Candidatus Chlorohelix allophototropha TaxID=3003348 RepID=A0A8T7M4L2_9CHLR|nr:hypothetical protein [Chloroflexota bacterium]WJW70344.1 hypothetical protein OZ401_004915 [Chloroflexota bacterium L227-S17]